MELLDVIVVGGGPAGSTCAGLLKDHGLSVTLVEKAAFPRAKLCAGWVTPGVFETLHLSPETYGLQNVLEPISMFTVWDRKQKAHEVAFGKTVSYGVVRKEFDAFLLKRSGVKTIENLTVRRINYFPDHVEVNGTLAAKMIVGAGGHFCPVSSSLGNSTSDMYTLAAMESETELDDETIKRYVPYPGSPEVIYLDDLKGYAWYFSKGRYLNIGIGSLRRKDVRRNLSIFLEKLRAAGRLPDELFLRLNPFTGHAYKMYPGGKRIIAGERVLLIGDSAGVSSNTSGEGIGPAVLSAVLAAETITQAQGEYTLSHLHVYNEKIVSAFGKPDVQSSSSEVSSFEKFVFDKLLLGTGAGRRYIIKHLFL